MDSAAREKHRVALSSLLAAVLLTGLKLGVGLWTNSLGILSEAAHSALDLVAAGVTLWAVRISGRPADRDHSYGHGKFENLSALLETLLLLGTCVWIGWEACQRLVSAEAVHVEASGWAFGVVLLSIVVDYSRSRALRRVATKYKSQALEADALHFSTDIYSSAVVLLGLAGVRAADALQLPWLAKADAASALGVAAIVVAVSLRLGKRAVDDLLDRVPEELHAGVTAAAEGVSGVKEVRQVRIRRSGPEVFMDLTVTVCGASAFEDAHDVASRTETAVRTVSPGADVVVHVEPQSPANCDIATTARRLAARRGLFVHGVRQYDDDGRMGLELHLEVEAGLRVDEAHRRASELEAGLREALPRLGRIDTHIEPAGQTSPLAAETVGQSDVEAAIAAFVAAHPPLAEPHRLAVRSIGGELSVSLHCRLPGATTIGEAHDVSERLEAFLRQRVPGIGRVTVHVEPLREA